MIFTYREAYELKEKVKSFLGEVGEEVNRFVRENKLLQPSRRLIKKLDPEFYEIVKRRLEGGKKVRPAMIVAISKAICRMKNFPFEKVKPKLLPYMVRREAKHAGYLEIDDVQDKSKLRRGEPSTWVEYGLEVAINSGLFLSDAVAACSRSLSYREPYRIDEKTRTVVDEIDALIAKRTIEGQEMDIKFRASPELSQKIAELIYQGKTGAYTIGSGTIGAGITLGMCEPEIPIEELREFCMKLFDICVNYFGPAFQSIDDWLNLIKPQEVPKYGKEWADDLEEGKPTIIVAFFNERATPEDKEEFYKYFGSGELNDKEKERLIELLDKYGARKRARNYAKRKLHYGLKKLEKIIPRECGEELYALLEFTVKRTY